MNHINNLNLELEQGFNILSLIKSSTRAGKVNICLPVGKPIKAFLRPISTNENFLDMRDIKLLSEWRNRYVKSFLTEFHAYEERTARWLVDSVGNNSSKILFMVDTLDRNPVGQVGLGFIDWQAGYGEADAIVSGGDSPPGLMKMALKVMLEWAKDQLGLKTLGVRVRSDNTALDFYKKVGFVERKRILLNVRLEPGFICWYEDTSLDKAEASLVYMIYEG